MSRIRLVHWNTEERGERAKRLRKAGFEVDASPIVSQETFKTIRRDPPDVFVIDLSRLPMHGRDVALAMRQAKSTRFVPIVFADGLPDKTAKVKKTVPDAVFTSWRGIRGAIKRAMANPSKNPAVPTSSLAGYSGTSLPKKLGIKEGFTVAIVDAPDDFETTLGELPQPVRVLRNPREKRDLTIWFVRNVKTLEKKIDSMVRHGDPGLWICWPKKTSPLASDIDQQTVREAGLSRGIVDYKVCAVDATWSWLKFTTRKARKGG